MEKILKALFYKNPLGKEPVKDWLKELSREDRKAIGCDILTVEYGWPIGMPTCKPLGEGILEVRTHISGGRIARVLFFIDKGTMYLLHGFIKKTQKTPLTDVELAKSRKNKITLYQK